MGAGRCPPSLIHLPRNERVGVSLGWSITPWVEGCDPPWKGGVGCVP